MLKYYSKRDLLDLFRILFHLNFTETNGFEKKCQKKYDGFVFCKNIRVFCQNPKNRFKKLKKINIYKEYLRVKAASSSQKPANFWKFIAGFQ
jgi:hypothetical protein